MAAKPDTSFLYIIGTGDGPSKMGHSAAPERRLKEIQRTTKGAVILIGKWPVGGPLALAVERYVHWQIRHSHIRGEWFNLPPSAIVTVINDALQRQGEFDSRNPIPSLDCHGRKISYADHMQARFPDGTFDRIEAVLVDGEDRTAFVRAAVERELRRRERAASR